VSDQVWFTKTLTKLIQHEAIRFLVVGAGGFVINIGMLWILHGKAGLPLLVAQLISAELAILFNFCLHHAWTYRNYQSASLALRVLKFHATAWTGAAITTVTLTIWVYYLGLNYLVGLTIGGIVAMAWNYALNLFVIWRKG
jgi:dolichol-phosphate mannosyltransferase